MYLAINFFIVIISAISLFKGLSKYSNLFSIYSLLLLLLLAALRDQVGTDWNAYYNFYVSGNAPVELGYAILNDNFSSSGLNYNYFLLLINSICLYILYLSFINNSPLSIISVLLFSSDLFYYLNLSGVRQALAFAIVLYSVQDLKNNNTAKFIIKIIFASLFHYTAILFIICVIIRKEKYNVKNYIYFSLIILLVFYLFEYLILFFSEFTGKNYMFYLTNQENVTTLINYLVGITRRIIPIFIIVFYYKYYFVNKNNQLFFNIYLLGFLIYLLTYNLSPDIGVRLSLYFCALEYFMIPILLINLKIKDRLIVCSIYIALSFYKILQYTSYDAYIYKTII